ncbi:MAG: hypothetical protein D6826_05405 [Alphaproteobacteria bacterium]|nr:MAG: hypothetical protein D6826_05405 [Alphaproteobacteria bacterium]
MRYVKLFRVDKDRVLGFVADADQEYWSGLTFFSGRAQSLDGMNCEKDCVFFEWERHMIARRATQPQFLRLLGRRPSQGPVTLKIEVPFHTRPCNLVVVGFWLRMLLSRPWQRPS